MYFNPYAILPFVTSIVSLALGSLVYSKNKKSKLNLTFFFWCFAIFIWLLAYSICYSIKDPNIAIYFSKTGCSAVMYFSPIFFHFINILLRIKRNKFFILLGYTLATLILVATFTTDYIFTKDLNPYFFGYYGRAGSLYIYTIIFFLGYMSAPLFMLLNALRKNTIPENKRLQAKYILFGFCIVYLASIDFIPKFDLEFYPFGAIFILLWVIIMSYAIIKHQLLEIQVVIKKGLLYSLLVSIITLFYLTSILIFEKIFQGLIGYNNIIATITTSIIIAIFFIPLRNKLQFSINKLFYKNSPDELFNENIKLKEEVAQTEKYKTLSTLSSGVAHEVKNPLTALKTFCEYLPEKLEDKDFLLKFSKLIGKEVDRIDDLVHQLLDYSKPAAPIKTDTQITKLIDDTLSMLTNSLSKQKIETVKDYQINTDLTVKIDQNQIKQALLNIFMNAIDAMPDGGTLTIGIKDTGLEDQRTKEELTSNPKILNSSNPQLIQISITDTGIGMSKDDIKHIFDPVYTQKENGTGLGMSITQQIIEKHKGKIEIYSKENKETTIIISLPLTV